MGEKTDAHLTTISFCVVLQSTKASTELLSFQAKESQFPHRTCAPGLSPAHCPSLRSLHHLNVFRVVTQKQSQHLMYSLTGAEHRGTVTNLVLLATLLLIQARMPLLSWPPCWLMSSCCQPSCLGLFPPGSFPATLSPNLLCHMGLL